MAGQRAGRIQNFFGRGFDRLVPGNNWNPNAAPGARWNATPTQYIGAVGGVVGNAIAPGAGNLIRSGVHGATTGQGIFGWLQPQGSFTGNPVPAMTFNPNVISAPGGLTPATLTPATQIPFTNTATTSGPLPFNPNAIDPNMAQSGPGTQQQSFLGPRLPTGMGGLTGFSASNGGARGAFSRGGFTGDAARALLQALQQGPQSIYTGGGGPIAQ